jgi:large subunit ribosomal protein L22
MAQDKQERPVKNNLLAQITALNEADEKKVIKTRARKTKIRKEFVGHTLAVFNGQGYTRVHITPDMEGRTLAKVAPRQIADLVQGLPAEEALGILNFTPKVAAQHMARTLKSAVANKLSLEGTDRLDPEDLWIKQIMVSAGPTAKRIQFRSMGRVYRIRKRYCHLAIYLAVKSEAIEKIEAAAEPARAGKKTRSADTARTKKARTTTKSKAKKTAKKPAKKTTGKTAKKTTKKTAGKTDTKKTASKTGTKKTTAKKSTAAKKSTGAKKTTAKKTTKADKPKADKKKK